jgi:hypothetical protein
MSPKWCSEFESNEPSPRYECGASPTKLSEQVEPGRRIERRILRLQNGRIASNAYRASWSRTRDLNPASFPYQGIAPPSGPERQIGRASRIRTCRSPLRRRRFMSNDRAKVDPWSGFEPPDLSFVGSEPRPSGQGIIRWVVCALASSRRVSSHAGVSTTAASEHRIERKP